MKNPRVIGAVFALLLMVFCGFEITHQTGIVRTTKKNGYGCLCHSFEPDTAVRVWITGPETLAIGEEALYAVHVARDTNIAAGFNVAAFFGDLGIEDTAGTKLDRENSSDSLELTHTLPRFAQGSDTISWLFRFRAPLIAGIVDTLYSVCNSVNNDTLPNEMDHWNFGENFLVRVTGTTDIADTGLPHLFSLDQNYPNPFNPTTSIRFHIPAYEHVTLKVFDISGKEIATLVNNGLPAGRYERTFNAENLASGVYLYRLTTGSHAGVRKMLLIK